MIERSWDVARTQTNPTMRLTLDIARRKWEESGREVEWAKIIRRLFGPNRPFFGKQSNISPVCAMLAYKCHTWLESCWKCGFLGENSFGSSLILWAQGILSSRDQEPDPLAYTSSYPFVKRNSNFSFLGPIITPPYMDSSLTPVVLLLRTAAP